MSLIKQLGQFPDNERKLFFETLSNYKNGQFHNLVPTPALAEGEKMGKVLWNFLKTKFPDTKPKKAIPYVNTDLKNLNPEENVMVWFGHSSYLIQLDGMTFLTDPVLSGNASPKPASVSAF